MTSLEVKNLKPNLDLLNDFENEAIINGYCIDKDDSGNYTDNSTYYLYEGWLYHHVFIQKDYNKPNATIEDLEYEIEQLEGTISDLEETKDDIIHFIDTDISELLNTLSSEFEDRTDIDDIITKITYGNYY